MEILDEPTKIVSRHQAENALLHCVYFQLTHVAPNENSDQYRSLWSHITSYSLTDELTLMQEREILYLAVVLLLFITAVAELWQYD